MKLSTEEPQKKEMVNKTCACGRKYITMRNPNHKYRKEECSTCRTLGLEESRKQFLQLKTNRSIVS